MDKKILIIGDSFACPWLKPKYDGWPTLLAKKYNLDNYRIATYAIALKKIEKS